MAPSRIPAAALAVGTLAAGLFAAAQPASAADPAVTVLSINGSGCPTGTTVTTTDGTQVEVTYTAFAARAGVGAPATEARRNCQLALQLHPGAGFAATVTGTDYTAQTNLSLAGSALLRTSYYAQGSSAATTVTSTTAGPRADTWPVSQPATVTGPCGTDWVANVNGEVRASSPGAPASVSVDHSTTHVTFTACGV